MRTAVTVSNSELLLDLGHGRLARGDERQHVLLLEVVAVLGRELDHAVDARPGLPNADHVSVEPCDDAGAQVADAGDERLLFRAPCIRRDLPFVLRRIAVLRNVLDRLHRLGGRNALDHRRGDHDRGHGHRTELLQGHALSGLATGARGIDLAIDDHGLRSGVALQPREAVGFVGLPHVLEPTEVLFHASGFGSGFGTLVLQTHRLGPRCGGATLLGGLARGLDGHGRIRLDHHRLGDDDDGRDDVVGGADAPLGLRDRFGPLGLNLDGDLVLAPPDGGRAAVVAGVEGRDGAAGGAEAVADEVEKLVFDAIGGSGHVKISGDWGSERGW